MCRAVRFRPDSDSGFTIIEVLVALAIVAASLAAIGALMASTSRGANRLDRHVALSETARAVAATLPPREQLAGNLSGELSGYPWRVDVLPFAADHADTETSSPWLPQTVVISVRSSDGTIFQMSTVRLRRGTAQ